MSKKFIFYEINELPMLVIERYAAKFPSSSLAYLYQNSKKYQTVNSDSGSLSPWVTWPSLHRGVNNDVHGISDLGQNLEDINQQYPNFFNTLANSGIKVGIFGTLHTYPLPLNVSSYSFYLPDVFAATPDAFPEKLKLFQGINLRFTAKNARNVRRAIPFNEIKLFATNFFGLGISFKTVLEILRQLFGELIDPTLVVKRRIIQAKLAFDIYFKLLNENKPQFSTFFTNHVASAMHRYWPATFPGDYLSFRMPEKWVDDYADVIWDAMSELDSHLQRLLQFIEKNEDYTLVILSSMGQAPVQDVVQINNELLIGNVPKFMRNLGVLDGNFTQLSAMVPRYIFRFDDEHLLNAFTTNIGKIRVRGSSLYCKLIDPLTAQVSLGHENFDPSELVEVDGVMKSIADLGLEAVAIQDLSGSYAYHIAEGSLLVFNGKGFGVGDTMIPVSKIAPSILNAFGIKKPSYMDEPLPIF